METTILGKISEIYFGKKDQRIGLWITLSGSSSVQSSYDCWDPEDIKITENTKWTEEDRNEQLIVIMRKLSELLKKAKVNDIQDLKNIPVEITFSKHHLDSWRILEEVL